MRDINIEFRLFTILRMCQFI